MSDLPKYTHSPNHKYIYEDGIPIVTFHESAPMMFTRLITYLLNSGITEEKLRVFKGLSDIAPHPGNMILNIISESNLQLLIIKSPNHHRSFKKWIIDDSILPNQSITLFDNAWPYGTEFLCILLGPKSMIVKDEDLTLLSIIPHKP